MRLNGTITEGNINGYEFNYSIRNNNISAGLVRWNGPFGNFTSLTSQINPPPPRLNNGDILCLTNDGSGLLTATRNGTTILQARDRTYLGGSPGIGLQISGPPTPPTFYLGLFGFSSFTGSSK
jgi:hypothetical protein